MNGPATIIALALALGPAKGTQAPSSSAPSAAQPSPAAPASTPSPAAAGAEQPQPDTAAGADGPATEGAPGETPASEVTRYQFTGLDIDGELRTPALLHFLARIGGEFETVGIPHRSFIPELRSTTSADAL